VVQWMDSKRRLRTDGWDPAVRYAPPEIRLLSPVSPLLARRFLRHLRGDAAAGGWRQAMIGCELK
jgi:hypothetical protein